jgi:hypothetical protein
VSLQNVGCSVHACAALAELLPPASSLAGLHLFNNMSGDEGAGHIARLLARLPGCMADFKMASSRVGPAGGISIAKALGQGARCAGGGWRGRACWRHLGPRQRPSGQLALAHTGTPAQARRSSSWT